MKARHLILFAALAVSAWLALFGDKDSSPPISEPADRASVPRPPGPTEKSAPNDKRRPSHEDVKIGSLVPRETLIGGAHIDKPAEGLFGSQSWNPPPPPPPKPPPPPPPAAPPLPFVYLGKKFEDGAWEIYLGKGDQTVIAKVNGEIDSTYRVESVKPPTLTLKYLPLNEIQTINIGGAE
jgi:hypothetical protein